MKRSVLMVPAQANIHMPEAMRPLADFYIVVSEKALEEVVATQPRPTISRGPRWKNNREAKIIKRTTCTPPTTWAAIQQDLPHLPSVA